MAEKARPGVMIYFEDFEPVAEVFDNEKLGEFIRAVVNYAKTGEWISNDADPTLRAFLRMFKPKIDRDGERYTDVIAQRQYAVYCREVKKTNSEPLSFSDWKLQRLLSTDNGSYPTATAIATANSIATTTPTSTTTTMGKGIAGGYRGTERENLSYDEQFQQRKQKAIEELRMLNFGS